MKRFFRFLGLGLVVIVGIVVTRLIMCVEKPVSVAGYSTLAVNTEAAAERLGGSVRFETVSHLNSQETDFNQLVGLRNYLEKQFPLVHKKLKREVIGGHSLLFTWPGKDSSLKPILLLGHMDVVPAVGEWSFPAFSGKVENGYIWGRGTIDDKVAVLGILEAAEALLKSNFEPERSIYFAFGHDEEVGGNAGAAEIAKLLRYRGVRFEFVVDEGMVIADGGLDGVKKPMALIGTSMKGYLTVELSVKGQGGHSSMPPPHTAVGILSRAITRLEDNQVPAKLDGTFRQFLEYIAHEVPISKRLVLTNLWLFGPLVSHEMQKEPTTNAFLRTTTAATMFSGSPKDNVLPLEARATVNFRVHPHDSNESVLAHMKDVIDDNRVTITPEKETITKPFSGSRIDSTGYKVIETSVRQIFPEVTTAPSLFIGGADIIHYAELSQDLYMFQPLWMKPEDMGRFHGTDERLSVDNYARYIKYIVQVMRNSQTKVAPATGE